MSSTRSPTRVLKVIKVPEKSSTCLHISLADWFEQFAEAVQAASERRPAKRHVFDMSITESPLVAAYMAERQLKRCAYADACRQDRYLA